MTRDDIIKLCSLIERHRIGIRNDRIKLRDRERALRQLEAKLDEHLRQVAESADAPTLSGSD